jgi:hypothetical protein
MQSERCLRGFVRKCDLLGGAGSVENIVNANAFTRFPVLRKFGL